MSMYHVYSLLAVTLFSVIHLYGNQWLSASSQIPKNYIYSIGGGVAIAYIFIDLLPKLCIGDFLVTAAVRDYMPFLEKHVYILALSGFILFYLVDKAQDSAVGLELSLVSYGFFNFLVGYAIADPFNPEVRPLLLFSFAIGLHLFVNDHSLKEKLGEGYQQRERWILSSALYLGWMTGLVFELPAAAVALVSAFIGGGVVMNVTRHELPPNSPNSTPLFLGATLLYTIILLCVGR